MNELKHSDITDKILEAFFRVYNVLGYGFLEKVYENALLIELKKLGFLAVAQHPIRVIYDNTVVGEYFADILVNNTIIIEIKAAKAIMPEHEAQLLKLPQSHTTRSWAYSELRSEGGIQPEGL